MKDLHRCLIDYDMAMLRAIAECRGIELTAKRRPEAVEQLSHALLEPESVAEALAWLSPPEREALDEVMAAGGRVKAHLFARRHGPIRPFGPGRLEREEPWLTPVSSAERLWYLGLIFKAFDDLEGQSVEFVFIPDDLRPLLPPAQREPPRLTVEPMPAPPVVQEGDTMIGDVFAFLSYLQRYGVRPRRDGSIPSQDTERLRLSDPARLAFVHHLCVRMGLVHVTDRRLKPEPVAARQWLRAPRPRQRAALQTAWRDDPEWDELRHVPGLECEDTGWHNDPLATRHRFLALLARCPAGAWLSLPDFVQAIKDLDPDFQRPDGDYASWYIRQAATGRYLTGFEFWDEVEGALAVHFVAGPLYWLGIVSLGYHRAGGATPVAFRITAAGAAFLGLSPPLPDGPPPSPIAVRPDLTIHVPPAASLYDRFQVERLADPEPRGEPHTYRLSPPSLGQALGQGVNVETVVAFLQRASGDRLPPRLALTLRQWAAKHGQVTAQRVILLRTKSEMTMRELRSLPQTKRYLREQLSPTTALVAEDDWPRLAAALRKLGYGAQVE